jgi:hypothetical protein
MDSSSSSGSMAGTYDVGVDAARLWVDGPGVDRPDRKVDDIDPAKLWVDGGGNDWPDPKVDIDLAKLWVDGAGVDWPDPKVDIDLAKLWVDGAGVDWPARKALCPVACVRSTSSAISSKRGKPLVRRALAMGLFESVCKETLVIVVLNMTESLTCMYASHTSSETFGVLLLSFQPHPDLLRIFLSTIYSCFS